MRNGGVGRNASRAEARQALGVWKGLISLRRFIRLSSACFVLWISSVMNCTGQGASSTHTAAPTLLRQSITKAKQSVGEEITIVGTEDPEVYKESDLLHNFGCIRATPIARRATASEDGVFTWYLLKVASILRPVLACGSCDVSLGPPAFESSSSSHNMTLMLPGGTATVDGIRIHYNVRNAVTLDLNQEYIFFISRTPTYAIPAGLGRYTLRVDNDGALHSLLPGKAQKFHDIPNIAALRRRLEISAEQ